MFSRTITESDEFLDMPLSTQALYFHLCMYADDDGFLNGYRKIMRMIGATQNEYDLLVAKKFILTFDDGIVVIKHWLMHNYIRKDRYKPSVYTKEKEMLFLKSNKAYTLDESKGLPLGIPMVDQRLTQSRVDKISIEENRLDKISIFSHYESNISTLTPIISQKLMEYQKELPDELIKLAIDKTAMANAKSFNYLNTILIDWVSKGYKNVSDLESKQQTGKIDFMGVIESD